MKKLTGLIAATYTPFDSAGNVNVSAVPEMVNDLLRKGVSGLYVCGSTGEGMSLTTEERMEVTEAFVAAAAQRVPVVVQVGHNSLKESQRLAAAAAEAGADSLSATCPSYFKVNDVRTLTDCMVMIAGAAPALPFYYYHIPALTGSVLDMKEFLQYAADRIPNLAGLKYTDTKLHEYQECTELMAGRFDVLWGCDEMLLAAFATGCQGAIGSTYNVAAPLYLRLRQAFDDCDLVQARRLQALAVAMIRVMKQYPFHAAMKAVMTMQGHDVGGCRLPQGKLTEQEIAELRKQLVDIGFFEWCNGGNMC